MITIIAAALAASTPAAGMQMPAGAHEQHKQMGQADQHEQMSKKMDGCCCDSMKDKMDSGHDMDGMQNHQDHGGR